MRMVMTTKRPPIGHLLLEAFFVVLAVGLAWAANEWRTHRVEQRQAQDTLGILTEELSSNRDAVLRSYTYHLELSDSLYSLIRRDTPASQMTFRGGFISREMPLHAAWDAAQASGRLSYVADHVGQDVLLGYANVYQRQHIYSEQKNLIGHLIYERLMDRGMQSLVQNYRNHTTIVGSMVYLEFELLNLYNTILQDSTAVPPPFRR
ncbi:MAG: hypothetical protein RhofKO_29410 [Rhodothermales bacterium]